MDTIAAEALESFLPAIYNGELQIKVCDGKKNLSVTHETIPMVLKQVRKKARNAAAYYEVLTGNERKLHI